MMFSSNERQAGLALILKIWNDHSRRNPKGLKFSGGFLVMAILLSSCGGDSDSAPTITQINDLTINEDQYTAPH
jgi:hypothetical protein